MEETYIYEPIDLEECFDPVFEPPEDGMTFGSSVPCLIEKFLIAENPGFSAVMFALVIWVVAMLIKDPKGVIKKNATAVK